MPSRKRPGIGLLDAVERLGDRARFGGPDVDDPGGQLAAWWSARGWDPPTTARPAGEPPDPDGAVAERLDVLQPARGQPRCPNDPNLPRLGDEDLPEDAEGLRCRHGPSNLRRGGGYSVPASASSPGVGVSGAGATSGRHTMNRVSPGLRLTRDVAVVLLHDDPPGQVEAESGALAERLGGEERREDPVDDVSSGMPGPSSQISTRTIWSFSRAVRIVSVPLRRPSPGSRCR